MSALFGGNLFLLDKLAVGGMGEVFRAKQIGAGGFEKIVAVKRILPQFASRAEFEKMFRMEMNLCASLQHSNIVHVFSNGQDGDYLYLVMEFVDGKNSAELLGVAKKKRLRIPVQFTCFIIAEAAKGLQYAHTLTDEATRKPLNIVHRDVTPQNIMFSYDGNVKVCDFGIAKAAHRGNMTRPGDLKGKVPYVSPEHIDGHPLDARADVFSLGIVLYEMLSQRALFAAPTSAETLKNIKEKPIPSLSERFADIPPELERITLKALERERERRYSSAEAMYRDLMVFLNQNFPKFAQPDFARFVQDVFKQQIELEQRERKNQLAQLPMRVAERRVADQTVVPDASDSDYEGGPTTIYKAIRLFSVSLLITLLLGLGAMLMLREWSIEPRAPSSISGLIADFKAKNVEVDAEQQVLRWSDISGKMTLTPPSEKNRPDFYDAFVGGQAAIHFDGLADYLIGDEIAGLLKTPALSIAVLAKVGRDEDQYLWSIHARDRVTDVLQMGLGFGQLLRLKMLPTKNDDSYLVSERVKLFKFSTYLTVLDPQQISLFQDGRLVIRAKAEANTPLNAAETLSIGQEYDPEGPSSFFMGEIAEIAIFNVALKEEERRGLQRYFEKEYFD